MKMYNPATGVEIKGYKEDDPSVCRTAVEKAAEAQKIWGALPVKERGKRLLRVRGEILDSRDSLAHIISTCTGKTKIDALATEVLPGAVAVGYYVKQGKHVLKPRKIKGSSLLFFNKRSRLHRVPWGVVGIISPWNYPFGIPFHEVFSALITGNAVVLKVATQVQPVGDALVKLFSRCDLPEHLLSLIHVKGSDAGKGLLDAGVNKLFFTGSVAVGKKLMELASHTLTPVSLELGGNDGMIVTDDVNLKRAARGAVWAGISNCGQSCGGVERVYVHKHVYSEFMKELKSVVESLRQGPDTNLNVDFGSLTTENQLKTVKAHIADAVKKGAAVFAQSKEYPGEGIFHPAVVLENVNHSMDIMKDETFGPVLAVMKVDSADEAVALTNDSNLGLTASVWCRSTKQAETIAQQVDAGAVTLNDHLMSHGMSETPWGGFKESSIGRCHGEPGLHEMTQTKVIIKDTLHFLPLNIWWHPYDRSIYEGLSGAMDAFWGKGPGNRIKGAFKIAGLYISRLFKS